MALGVGPLPGGPRSGAPSPVALGVGHHAGPAGALAGVQAEVRVEVGRLVEALAAHVAAEGLLPSVDAVVPPQHADRGEALAAHGAAVWLLFGVPAHVDLQLAGEAETLAALPARVHLLQALALVRGPRGPEGPHALEAQGRHAHVCIVARVPCGLRVLFLILGDAGSIWEPDAAVWGIGAGVRQHFMEV